MGTRVVGRACMLVALVSLLSTTCAHVAVGDGVRACNTCWHAHIPWHVAHAGTPPGTSFARLSHLTRASQPSPGISVGWAACWLGWCGLHAGWGGADADAPAGCGGLPAPRNTPAGSQPGWPATPCSWLLGCCTPLSRRPMCALWLWWGLGLIATTVGGGSQLGQAGCGAVRNTPVFLTAPGPCH